MMFRAPALLMDSIRHLSGWHGRSMTGEMRLYADLGVNYSMLALLDDPEFVDELRGERHDFDVDGLRADVKSQVADLRRVIVKRRKPSRFDDFRPPAATQN